MYVHFLSWLFYSVFCVFRVFIVLSVHFLSSSCLLFVSSGFCIWASLPEIKRWNGMDRVRDRERAKVTNKIRVRVRLTVRANFNAHFADGVFDKSIFGR